MSIIDTLKAQRAAIDAQILEIQSLCMHPTAAVTKKGDSSTGGYDKGSDSYWYAFHCGLCDKRWTEDQ